MASTKKEKTEGAAPEETLLTLTMLRPAKGSTKKKLRVGRGRASGAGKTSNRGHNGEGQRSGQGRKRGFEGGQMPGYRQMPKINGFTMVNRREWLELNVGDLADLLTADQSELTYETLRQLGLMKPKHDGVRLLGNGTLARKIAIQVHHATPSAREKVESAGGTVQLLS